MSTDDNTKFKNDDSKGDYDNSKDDSKTKSKNITWGTLYLIGMTIVASTYVLPPAREFKDKTMGGAMQWMSYVAHKRGMEKEPISNKLSLEGMIANQADNLVRISSMAGVGCGVLINPYEIMTAHHVVSEAFSSPHEEERYIFIQSQTYLGKSKSMRILLDSTIYDYNSSADLGKILLKRPVIGAKHMVINKSPDFSSDPNIHFIGYRDNALYHQLGEVKSEQADQEYFFGSINVGPGNSGSPIFNAQDELVGITSMALMRQYGSNNKYDNGPIIFTNINNPLINK